MKALHLGLAAHLVFMVSAHALADDSDLAKSKGCLACHAVDQTKAAPSFKSLATKYAGKSDAAAALMAKLRDGKGHLKAVASDAELKTLIAYILAIK